MTSGPPNLHRHDSEKYFTDPSLKKGDKKVKFPSIHDQGSIDLSVIVPAYNEEDRCKFNVLIVTVPEGVSVEGRPPACRKMYGLHN